MVSKRTPGPWYVSSFTGDSNPHTFVAQGGLLVAHCRVTERPIEECEANALLIAAAPDLLAALRRIMHYASMGAAVCDVDTFEQPEFLAARAAIAKAGA
jgi:hypothetical protein